MTEGKWKYRGVANRDALFVSLLFVWLEINTPKMDDSSGILS